MSEAKQASERLAIPKVFGIVVLVALVSLVAVAIFAPLLRSRSPKNECISNLHLIDSAKQKWALKFKKSPSEVPSWDDIKVFIGTPSAEFPKCPEGGTYALGAVSNLPTCSIPGHRLP